MTKTKQTTSNQLPGEDIVSRDKVEGSENDIPTQSGSSNPNDSGNQRDSLNQTNDGSFEKTEKVEEKSRPPMIRIGRIGFVSRRYAVLCAAALFFGSVPLGMTIRLLWAVDGAPPSARRTLVIRHLQNLTTDARQDGFCKGLSEELLAELSRKKPDWFDIVIEPPSNQAFENSSSKRSIFELEGSVRKEGHTLRIAIELNELQSKRVKWAELYEGDDESQVSVERDVAAQIAKGILTRL